MARPGRLEQSNLGTQKQIGTGNARNSQQILETEPKT